MVASSVPGWAWCRVNTAREANRAWGGRITKEGDPYLRTLLIMGGKAVLAAAKDKTDSVSRWALNVQARRGYWCAVVAVAAKNARLCWAMLQQGEAFKMPA